jgi:hypothetical protein
MGLGVVHEEELVDLHDWLDHHGLTDELENDERELLHARAGEERKFHVALTSWRVEGAAVLAWALGLLDLPAHDQRVDRADLHATLGFLSRTPVVAPTLRDTGQLVTLAHQIELIHWRLRVMPARRIDMTRYARVRPTPVDLTGVPLVDGDLAIGGVRISQAPVEALDRCLLIVKERHRGINWLLGSASRYGDVITAT